MVKSDKHEHILRILGDVSCFRARLIRYASPEKRNNRNKTI